MAGRPTLLTADLQEEICELVQAGNYLETAAACAGVGRTTVFAWMRRGRQEMRRVAQDGRRRVRNREAPYVAFLNAVGRAQAHAEAVDVTTIGVAAASHWQAAAWRLERKFPNRWGRRLQMEASVQVQPQEEQVRDKLGDLLGNSKAHDLARQLALLSLEGISAAAGNGHTGPPADGHSNGSNGSSNGHG